MIKRIIVDLDGVLANFCKAALSAYNINPNTKIEKWNFFEDFGLTEKEFWAGIRGKSFWFNIEPMPWMNDLITYIKDTGIPWIVATSPCRDYDCYSGKVEWLEKHLDLNYTQDAMIGSRKYLMANRDTILIDDSGRNCNKFIEYGGHSILFPATYNDNIKLVGRELEYVKGRLDYLLDG